MSSMHVMMASMNYKRAKTQFIQAIGELLTTASDAHGNYSVEKVMEISELSRSSVMELIAEWDSRPLRPYYGEPVVIPTQKSESTVPVLAVTREGAWI